MGTSVGIRNGSFAGSWPAVAVRATALVLIAGTCLAGFLATGHVQAAHAVSADGPELTRLLRSMALLKMVMAAAATAAILWRLGSAAGPFWLAAYATAGLAMWMGPGLIWHMAHLNLGALLLHGGLFGSLVLLWRDPSVGERLAAIIAKRRALLADQPSRR